MGQGLNAAGTVTVCTQPHGTYHGLKADCSRRIRDRLKMSRDEKIRCGSRVTSGITMARYLPWIGSGRKLDNWYRNVKCCMNAAELKRRGWGS